LKPVELSGTERGNIWKKN